MKAIIDKRKKKRKKTLFFSVLYYRTGIFFFLMKSTVTTMIPIRINPPKSKPKIKPKGVGGFGSC